MESVAKSEGRTVIFVSHNMGAVSTLCTRGIYLVNGRVREVGSAEHVIASYHNTIHSGEVQSLASLRLAGMVGKSGSRT